MTTLVKLNNNSPVFNSFFDDFFRRDLHAGHPYGKVAVNVKETKDSFILELVAPGFKREQISVTVEEQHLKIQGKVESEGEKEQSQEERYTQKEFNRTSFEKVYKLPNEVDSERISAKYEEGILFVEIPKKAKDENKIVRNINIG